MKFPIRFVSLVAISVILAACGSGTAPTATAVPPTVPANTAVPVATAAGVARARELVHQRRVDERRVARAVRPRVVVGAELDARGPRAGAGDHDVRREAHHVDGLHVPRAVEGGRRQRTEPDLPRQLGLEAGDVLIGNMTAILTKMRRDAVCTRLDRKSVV